MLSMKECSLSHEELLKIYEEKVLIRKFEEKCAVAYQQGLIIGFCHLYTGQEAVLCGIKANMQDGDNIITSYRCHTQAVLFSKNPYAVMCELLGREDGLAKGKGGSMHIFSPDNNFWGGHGIVGAQVPIGTGIAFAEKYKGTNNICVTMMGDGAVNQGQVYESWNMASLWGLPVLYVIENNKYAMGTAVERHSCNNDKLYKRCEAMGIEGDEVDGMDFFAVYNKAKELIEKVRNEQKPYVLQVNTYRYRGHSMSDPATYRTKDEVNSWKARDAVKHFGEKLVDMKVLTNEKIDEIDDVKTEEIDDVFARAKACKMTPLEELETDILV